MLMELSVIPLGRGRSLTEDVADLIKIVDGSGLDYRLTATGTLVEGEWDQLVGLARACHMKEREVTRRVLTLMRIDDYEGKEGRLDGAVRSVEKQLGITVKR